MAITTAICTPGQVAILSGECPIATAIFNIALYVAAATLGASTAAYTATNEISGTGYTAKGELADNPAVTSGSGVAFFDWDDVEWTSATFDADGCLMFDDDHASDVAIFAYNFGSEQSVVAGTFAVQFPAAASGTAMLRWGAAA